MPKTLVVGDSLGVGTVPYLRKLLGGQVDADVRVGRSSADGVDAMARKGGRYDRVMLDLGTNDGTAAQLLQSVRRARAQANGAQIYVATVRGPQAAEKNKMLRNLGSDVHVIDWAGASNGLVGGDGIHATGRGYATRAHLVASAMRGATAAGAPAPAATTTSPLPNAARNAALLAILKSNPADSLGLVTQLAATRRAGGI